MAKNTSGLSKTATPAPTPTVTPTPAARVVSSVGPVPMPGATPTPPPTPAPTPTPTPTPTPAPTPTPTPTPAPAAANGNVDAQGFGDTDTRGFHDLLGGRNYYNSQTFGVDTRSALKDYLDPNTTPGSLYNASQNMNHALVTGKLNAQQQFMYDSLVDGMHNIGQNINLTRYDHGNALDFMLRQATGGGITSFSGMSINQIKKALVGYSYSDKRILSTSFNNFKNAVDPTTFTSRMIKITYRAKAGAQGMMPGISDTPLRGSGLKKGDDFGEFLLAPTGTKGHNSYKVVDVKYSGKMARQKGAPSTYLTHKQIEVVVEVD